MKIGAVFSSYLKADDLGTSKPVVTIDRVVVEVIGQEKDKKPVVYFEAKEKGLVLNRVNADSITEIAGSDETDDWAGVQIQLYVDPKVMFQGKKTPAIRVRAPQTEPKSVKRRPAPEPEEHPDYGTEEVEEETPF